MKSRLRLGLSRRLLRSPAALSADGFLRGFRGVDQFVKTAQKVVRRVGDRVEARETHRNEHGTDAPSELRGELRPQGRKGALDAFRSPGGWLRARWFGTTASLRLDGGVRTDSY